ncbi:MAG: hypothetical protein MK200_08970 [Nitrosopumilus sp.]|nr:hypothetical protein [Nitrosopumilus sp.]
MKNKKTEERYYTYSGVPTKDTLSIKEQRELDEKKKNNTLTKEDREKLRRDDSGLSTRSTRGIFYKDRVKYNPNVDYFMMDYMDKKDMSHIRLPYMTQFEMLGLLRHFIEENGFDVYRLQIHSENELDTKLEVKCDDGEIREVSLRQILFDDRYENISKRVKDESSNFLKEIYERRNPSEIEMDEEEDKEDRGKFSQHQLSEMEIQIQQDQVRIS